MNEAMYAPIVGWVVEVVWYDEMPPTWSVLPVLFLTKADAVIYINKYVEVEREVRAKDTEEDVVWDIYDPREPGVFLCVDDSETDERVVEFRITSLMANHVGGT